MKKRRDEEEEERVITCNYECLMTMNTTIERNEDAEEGNACMSFWTNN